MHSKSKFKKILCLALSVLMLTSFLQTAVSATDSDGTGSEEAVTFTALDGTAGVNTSENYDKLLDGTADTKWCVTRFTSAYIVIEASSAISISGYQMTTGDDTARESARNPEDWTLYGCNDYNAESKEGTWEVIQKVIGDPVLQATNKTAYSFACDKTETPYKYFKLLITKNSGSEKCMQLSEFNFTYCEHETTVLNTRDADCTNYGYVEKNCSVCGLTYKMITSEALGHSWVTLSTTDATCTESGKFNQECSVCKATQTVNDPDAPALGHTWVTLSTTDATCEENGKINQECSVCKATQTVNDPSVPALGHNFANGTCTVCTRTDLECTQSPHDYPNNYDKTWTITREGAVKIAITFSLETKTENNYDFIYILDKEGNQIGRYTGTALAGQTIKVESDVVKIRLTSDSSSRFYGFSLTEIKAFYPCEHEHTDIINCVPVTCTEDGYSGDTHCLDCDDIIATGDTVPALGLEHSWVDGGFSKPTCTEGVKEVLVCSNCGDKQYFDIESAQALGHNFVDGACTRCSKTESEYVQSPHNYPNNYNKTWTITRKGAAKISITFSESTKTENGYDHIYIYDKELNQIDKYTGTALAGQTITVESEVIKIRMTSDGSTSFYGFSLTDITAEYACGHSDVNIINAVHANCNEDGYSGDVYCNTCKEVIVTGETLPAMGHNFVTVSTEPSHPHTTVKVCTNCGAKNTEKPTLDDCFECNFNFTKKPDNSYKLLSYIGSGSVISIPASHEEKAVTEIGTACFKGNETITEVVIPDSVTSIGALAFMGCANLSKVTIPASVTSIGTQAFYGFTGTIYCEKGSYAYEYAVANNIKYAIIGAEASENPINDTENTTVDYVNFVIYTEVENSSNIADILDLSDSAIAVPTASYAYGNLELYGTGTVVTVFDGGEYVGEFTLIVSGDVNGDSVCDVLDCSMAELAANGHSSLTGAYKTAADSNSDGTVDVTDYQAMVNKAVS